MSRTVFWLWVLAAYVFVVFVCFWLAGLVPHAPASPAGWAD